MPKSNKTKRQKRRLDLDYADDGNRGVSSWLPNWVLLCLAAVFLFLFIRHLSTGSGRTPSTKPDTSHALTSAATASSRAAALRAWIEKLAHERDVRRKARDHFNEEKKRAASLRSPGLATVDWLTRHSEVIHRQQRRQDHPTPWTTPHTRPDTDPKMMVAWTRTFRYMLEELSIAVGMPCVGNMDNSCLALSTPCSPGVQKCCMGQCFASQPSRPLQAMPPRMIFLGDGATAGWTHIEGLSIWNQYFSNPESMSLPLNFGIPGDATQNVLFRVYSDKHFVAAQLEPALRVVVVSVGAANLQAHQEDFYRKRQSATSPRKLDEWWCDENVVASVVDAISAVVDTVLTKLPHVTIAVMELIPHPRASPDAALHFDLPSVSSVQRNFLLNGDIHKSAPAFLTAEYNRCVALVNVALKEAVHQPMPKATVRTAASSGISSTADKDAMEGDIMKGGAGVSVVPWAEHFLDHDGSAKPQLFDFAPTQAVPSSALSPQQRDTQRERDIIANLGGQHMQRRGSFGAASSLPSTAPSSATDHVPFVRGGYEKLSSMGYAMWAVSLHSIIEDYVK